MSTASLSDLPKALNRETISCRLSWKLGRWLLDLGRASICRSENKIFKAVPNPWVCDTREAVIKTTKTKKSSSSLQKKHYKLTKGTKKKVTGTCSFPHRRHLKHPTQSMILEMLRKASLISSWHSQKTQVILNLESYPHKLKLQLQSVLLCVCSNPAYTRSLPAALLMR